MRHKNIILAIIATITLLAFITFATYAYLNVGSLTLTNAANINATSESNNMVFDTVGGEMSLNVTTANMTEANNGTLAASNTTTLTVNFTANSSTQYVCTYDIVFEWLSTDKYITHTTNVAADEMTIQASLTSNSYVNEGYNHIKTEGNLSNVVGSIATSSIVVEDAQMVSTGTSKSTAIWTLTTRFYNVNADQSAMADKTYRGRFKVDNVSCVAGTLDNTNTLAKYLINTATKSGTDTITSTKWNFALDKSQDWRYYGKNPNNYITFNGELWRIQGIRNTEYCTGTFSDTSCDNVETGLLVKIVRNESEGAMAWDSTNSKNKWQDSSLKTTLQSKSYASDSHVAVANWSLYGYTAVSRTAFQFYSSEINYNSLGKTYSGNPTYWYGKVGVPYVTDYAYASNGNGADTGTYSRTSCITRRVDQWTSTYKTNCVLNDWMWYNNFTSTNSSTGVAWWTLFQISGANTNVVSITANGVPASTAATSATPNVRPTVYLKPETLISGTHTGTYNDPYVIS